MYGNLFAMNAKGLENAKELNKYFSIRQISNVHKLPPELYTNAYIRCKVYGNPKDYKRIIYIYINWIITLDYLRYHQRFEHVFSLVIVF
jgi:hypothetical protein